MATTSFLYHAQGLRDDTHTRTESVGGAYYHHVRLQRTKGRCVGCGASWSELELAVGTAGLFGFIRALPDRIGADLAATDDQHEAKQRLDRELRAVLTAEADLLDG